MSYDATDKRPEGDKDKLSLGDVENLLKTLIEVEVYQNEQTAKVARKLDTAICILA
jgi:hypothetical protein